MTPYTLIAYDSDGMEIWQEKHRTIGDCLSSVAKNHELKQKRPLFCGLSTVDVDGVIHQISLTPESFLDSSSGGEYLIQRCAF